MSADQYLSTKAVRESTARIFAAAKNGQTNFDLHLDKLEGVADFVEQVIKTNYPDLKIPYHSRWGHFRAGNPKRLESLFQSLSKFDRNEAARRQIDLVIPSVLLDAGAGPDWGYLEEGSSEKIGRSEGLGIASFHMFLAGAFSRDNLDPLRSDASALSKVSVDDVRTGFQVSDSNPLVGLEGRAKLVQSLGSAVESNSEIFKGARPGGLVDYLDSQFGSTIPAGEILKALLNGMGSIWPGRIEIDGVNLGDVWEHPSEGKIAFHKLSQWLTYSILEPLEFAGFTISEMDQLTGLAEYRNGGLFVDGGVLTPKPGIDLSKGFEPSDPLIVEWRALTVALLDEIAPMIRLRLAMSEEQFPLAKVLEGGTWWAGRRMAKQRDSQGKPPIKIISDGTVF